MIVLLSADKYYGFSIPKLMTALNKNPIIANDFTTMLQLKIIESYLSRINDSTYDYLNENIGREKLQSRWCYNQHRHELYYAITSSELDQITGTIYSIPDNENLKQLKSDFICDCNNILKACYQTNNIRINSKSKKSILLSILKKISKTLNRQDLERIPKNE